MKLRPMKFRRLQDRILVRPLARPERSPGVIPPDKAAGPPTEGEIVAMGPGRRRKRWIVSPDMAVGDRVLFTPRAGKPLKVSGETLLVIRKSELLGVINRSALPGEPTTGPAPPTRKAEPDPAPGNRVRDDTATVQGPVRSPGHDQIEQRGMTGEPTIGPGQPRPGSDDPDDTF